MSLNSWILVAGTQHLSDCNKPGSGYCLDITISILFKPGLLEPCKWDWAGRPSVISHSQPWAIGKHQDTLPAQLLRRELAFITHWHSGSALEARIFPRLHLATRIPVDLEKDIDHETLHVWLWGGWAPKVNTRNKMSFGGITYVR